MTPDELLTDLAACLCAALTPDGEDDPGLCFCGVLPGDTVILDYMECDATCGMAWVRLTSAYPATGVGVLSELPGNCGTFLGLDIEIGVMRCLEQPDGGEPPDPEQYAAASALQSDDILAMRRAVQCCAALEDASMGLYQPVGPDGAVVGGVWQIFAVI